MTNKECSECSRTSDNKHFNCPSRMSDGRHFTDYRPKCMANINSPNDLPMNSYEYRQFLIHNAEKLMKHNARQAYYENMCGPCVEPYNIGTMLPEQKMVKCDTNTCRTYIYDQDGLGTGRQYTSDNVQQFQEEFLKHKHNEQLFLNSQTNCCLNTNDELAYYPWNGMVHAEEITRTAVPGGGPIMNMDG